MSDAGYLDLQISRMQSELDDLRKKKIKLENDEMQQRVKKLRLDVHQKRLDIIQSLSGLGHYALAYERMRNAGVTLTVEIQDELFPTIYQVNFLFTHASGSFKFYLYAYNDPEDEENPYFSFQMTVPERIRFGLLSSKNQAAWERIVKETSLPIEFHSIAYLSEFLLGHFTCNYNEKNFLKMYPDLLDTEERDFRFYYTGHGGFMPQVFEIKFMN